VLNIIMFMSEECDHSQEQKIWGLSIGDMVMAVGLCWWARCLPENINLLLKG
jgi:hypothetical protein